MVARQQELAQRQSMLLDGRDIGTRVLPNATLKIYLTASAEVRARRRFEELKAKGDPSTYEQVLADVRSRDERDTTRETDPLRPAEDAQVIDSSDMTREQVVEDVLRRVAIRQGSTLHAEEHLTPMYRAARGVAAFLLTCLSPVTYHHLERAQLDAPYILISNHNSLMDLEVLSVPDPLFREKGAGEKPSFTLVVPKAADDRCGPSQYGYGGVARLPENAARRSSAGRISGGHPSQGRRDGAHGKRNCHDCPAQRRKASPRVHRRQAGAVQTHACLLWGAV